MGICLQMDVEPSKFHKQDFQYSGGLVSARIHIIPPCLCQKSQIPKKFQGIFCIKTTQHFIYNSSIISPETGRFHMEICQIAASVSGGQNFFPNPVFMFENCYSGTFSCGGYGSGYAGSPSADNIDSHKVTIPSLTRYSRDIKIPSFACCQVSPP